MTTYRNPILPGFFPDPSIVRVGEDYYLANSTFQYAPAVILSHSRDLVHWEHIGHAVSDTTAIDLATVDDSCGVWAPDISWCDGTFHVFFSVVRRAGKDLRIVNYATQASAPTGPWSRPVALNEEGIDPSHFVEDGRHYMLVNPGARLIPLDERCTRVTGEPVTLWPGCTGRSPEGPHLLKRDGYYHLLLAEGGTGNNHCVTTARSRHLLGPYEACPHNPILKQTDPWAPIQKTGHGKWVQTQRGDWWMVYLCGRPNEGPFCTLGRETCLDPMAWSGDGWPVVNEGRGPSLEQARPALPDCARTTDYSDDFRSPRPGPQWHFVRGNDPTGWSLTERPGRLRLRAGPGLDAPGIVSALLQRERSHRYRARVDVEFAPQAPGEEAGLTCYYGRKNHLRLGIVGEAGGRFVVLSDSRSGPVARQPVPAEGPVSLAVDVRGQKRTFSWEGIGGAGGAFAELPDCRFLSDEGIVKDFNFTGTMVGLYACDGGAGSGCPADFGHFRVISA